MFRLAYFNGIWIDRSYIEEVIIAFAFSMSSISCRVFNELFINNYDMVCNAFLILSILDNRWRFIFPNIFILRLLHSQIITIITRQLPHIFVNAWYTSGTLISNKKTSMFRSFYAETKYKANLCIHCWAKHLMVILYRQSALR